MIHALRVTLAGLVLAIAVVLLSRPGPSPAFAIPPGIPAASVG
jgi:hypothetical protein